MRWSSDPLERADKCQASHQRGGRVPHNAQALLRLVGARKARSVADIARRLAHHGNVASIGLIPLCLGSKPSHMYGFVANFTEMHCIDGALVSGGIDVPIESPNI